MFVRALSPHPQGISPRIRSAWPTLRTDGSAGKLGASGRGGRGSLLRHPGDRGCVGFGRRSSPVNFEGIFVEPTAGLHSRNGTRLSAAIRALRGVTPASCSRDHQNAFTSLAPLEPLTALPGRVRKAFSTLSALPHDSFVRGLLLLDKEGQAAVHRNELRDTRAIDRHLTIGGRELFV